MKFSEMNYTRPDAEEIKSRATALIESLKTAEDFAAADEALQKMDALAGTFDTMRSISYVRHTIDTNDEFYSGEEEFFDGVVPELSEYFMLWNRALLESRHRAAFEEKYGSLMFINTEIQVKSFSPEIIGELQEENALTTEYDKLIASAKIPFEGETYTVAQMGRFTTDADDERRLAAWKAVGEFYNSVGERLDEIFNKLTKLRDEMGRKLGYDGYTQLGYYLMKRNCYDKNDIEKFRASVRKYLVPVADKIYRKQAERLGKSYPMNQADNALMFRSGNPRPQGTPEDILESGRKMYHELSQETAEFIDFMYDNELLDVYARTGKSGGGYCITLNDYKAPFIFANFNGTSHDVEVITHEGGHAFAAYMAKDVVPMDLKNPTMESCEVHSMSMEFFSWPWAESFFGEDTRKFFYSHLSGSLTFIPYGTMVDHFQHIMYEKPGMTPEERHETWKKLAAEYTPWVNMTDEIPFYGDGKYWQRQSHIYQVPFYYIDYCLAQSVALQFWALIQEDRSAAWEKYMKYTTPAGTKTFRDLVTGAGLTLPFGEDALKDVCAAAAEWLDKYDLTGIE